MFKYFYFLYCIFATFLLPFMWLVGMGAGYGKFWLATAAIPGALIFVVKNAA